MRHNEDTDSFECLPGVHHLAVVNLFRESNGDLQLTIAMADGAMIEFATRKDSGKVDGLPIDYVENLVIVAAGNMAERRKKDTRR